RRARASRRATPAGGARPAPGPAPRPAVTTTTPANGATSVPPGANISVAFTEAATVSGAWFSIACTTSGLHAATATVSGDLKSFTLDPDSDFASGEGCTVTVFAAQVVDQDGAPQNMTADYVFSFTTGQAF